MIDGPRRKRRRTFHDDVVVAFLQHLADDLVRCHLAPTIHACKLKELVPGLIIDATCRLQHPPPAVDVRMRGIAIAEALA